jgi:hypothetical protein
MSHPSPEKKLIHCKNCGNSFHGHYCNACGQDAHTDRIDKHFIYHEIQHGLFHIDKGILYTLKELFTNPGTTIRLFIEGKRIRHFKPLAFLLVMAGLYAFVNHYFNTSLAVNPDTADKNANAAIEAVNEFIKTHFAIYVLLQLPVSAYIYYLIFKKYGTNYMEQLVINAYLSGQRIFISLLLLPLSYYLVKTGHPFMYGAVDSVITILLFVWAYPQYYNTRPRFAVVWRAILGYIIIYILLVLLTSIAYTLLDNFPKIIA